MSRFKFNIVLLLCLVVSITTVSFAETLEYKKIFQDVEQALNTELGYDYKEELTRLAKTTNKEKVVNAKQMILTTLESYDYKQDKSVSSTVYFSLTVYFGMLTLVTLVLSAISLGKKAKSSKGLGIFLILVTIASATFTSVMGFNMMQAGKTDEALYSQAINEVKANINKVGEVNNGI